MKKSNVAIEIICTLHIVLFVNAATAKLPDHYNFQFGFTESPLIISLLAWCIYLHHRQRRTSFNIPAFS
jgi:hypothetical protein